MQVIKTLIKIELSKEQNKAAIDRERYHGITINPTHRPSLITCFDVGHCAHWELEFHQELSFLALRNLEVDI